MELKWSSNGAQMEPNGAQIKLKWSSNGFRLDLKWATYGGQMESGARFGRSRGAHGLWMVHDAREVSERYVERGRDSVECDMYNIYIYIYIYIYIACFPIQEHTCPIRRSHMMHR